MTIYCQSWWTRTAYVYCEERMFGEKSSSSQRFKNKNDQSMWQSLLTISLKGVFLVTHSASDFPNFISICLPSCASRPLHSCSLLFVCMQNHSFSSADGRRHTQRFILSYSINIPWVMGVLLHQRMNCQFSPSARHSLWRSNTRRDEKSDGMTRLCSKLGLALCAWKQSLVVCRRVSIQLHVTSSQKGTSFPTHILNASFRDHHDVDTRLTSHQFKYTVYRYLRIDLKDL